MKTQNFYYAIFSFLVIIFCVLTALRVFAHAEPEVQPKKKKHSIVKVTKDMIDDYKANGLTEMKLIFRQTWGGHVKLKLTGLRADGSIWSENLETVKNNELRTRNIEFGTISKDTTGTSLHQLFATGESQNWILTPIVYNSDSNYVSYMARTEGLSANTAVRLNPSPPAE